MEHARRIKMHYDNHMGKTHTATFRTVSHNRRIETKNVKTLETINCFLEKKTKLFKESTNLRTAVKNEVCYLEQRSKWPQKKMPDLTRFLSTFQKYEKDARE